MSYLFEEKVFKMTDDYNYEKEVEEKAKELKEFLYTKKSNYILYLNFGLQKDSYYGNNESEILEQVARDIISYKIMEKAYVKLMSEGIIYPIGISDGRRSAGFSYKIKNCTTTSHIDNMDGLIFNRFMKL